MNDVSKPKNSKMTRMLVGITLLGISACGGGGGNHMGPGGPQGPQPFPVFNVESQSTELYNDYPVTIQGEQNIDIRPKVDGYVDQIYIDEGEVVKQGQLLFTIRNPQYAQDVSNAEAAVSSAAADLSTAELAVKKAKPLVEKEIISQYELETAENTLKAKKAALQQAQATLANAQINLGYTKLTSPVNGIVGTIPYKTGSYVNSNSSQALTTVSNIGNVFAYFSLNEKQLLDFARNVPGKTIDEKLKNTPPVSLLLPDGSVYPDKGRIETISGQINTATGSSSFRATFPNPTGIIRSGSSGSIRIPQEVKNGLLVPQKSTYELQGKRFVYVVDKSGTVKSTEIQVMSLNAGQYYVVTDGLHAGQTVVYDGSSSLQDSAKIQPQPVAGTEVYKDLK